MELHRLPLRLIQFKEVTAELCLCWKAEFLLTVKWHGQSSSGNQGAILAGFTSQDLCCPWPLPKDFSMSRDRTAASLTVQCRYAFRFIYSSLLTCQISCLLFHCYLSWECTSSFQQTNIYSILTPRPQSPTSDSEGTLSHVPNLSACY